MDFSQERHFSAKQASSLGVVVLIHVLLASALIYCLHSTFKHIDPPITVFVDPPAPRPPEPQPAIDPQVKKVDITITKIERPVEGLSVSEETYEQNNRANPRLES